MNFNKYKDNGLSGLTNLGNTCFLNSIMQILSHTYELNEFLDLETYKQKLNKKVDSIMLVEWDELRKLLWKQNCVISPFKFVKIIQRIAQAKNYELFSGFNQNDVSEFLIFIIDCFHTALSREVTMTIEGNIKGEKDKIAIKCFERIKQIYEKDYSEIWKLFYGIQVSQLEKLTTDEVISLSPEPIFIINLPIPSDNKSPNLYDCLDLYSEGEILDGDNCIKDEKTNEKIAVRKKLMFWSLPDILVIDIKRFNSSNRKNQIKIDFPIENLDLSKYIIGYDKATYVYDLYGICNHSGSVMGGHYTAYVKNANDKWYHYNDTNISEIKENGNIISPKAYCFFYRKKNIQK